MTPTKESIERAMREFEAGEDAFYEKYSSGFRPRAHYIRIEGNTYPLKGLWAAANTPTWHNSEFNTYEARRGFAALGYKDTVGPNEKEALASIEDEAREGERHRREIDTFKRSAAIVAKAKAKHGYECMVCKFDFEKKYGSVGEGFIEAHHLEQVAKRAEGGTITKVSDIAVLCANCHRMVHKRVPPYTLDEMRAMLRQPPVN